MASPCILLGHLKSWKP